MKRPVKAMLTIGITLILISGVAYAADKKKRAKQPMLPQDSVPDEEAVKAELLATVEGQQGKVPRIDEGKTKSKDQIIAKQPKK